MNGWKEDCLSSVPNRRRSKYVCLEKIHSAVLYIVIAQTNLCVLICIMIAFEMGCLYVFRVQLFSISVH